MILFNIFFTLSVCAISAAALAQAPVYPVKPIRLLIPFAAGGGADVTTRPFVQRLSDNLGQPIVYENRGGAGGVLAGELVARAPADGYTLLMGAVGVMSVTAHLTKLSFDPLKDFIPISKIADVASVLAARPGFAPRNLKEIVAYAKASPGKLIWGVSGIGAPGHLAMERFKLEQTLELTPVFYKGAGPGTMALLTNEIDIMSANPGVFMPHIKAGRLRPIGTPSAQRIAIMPDLPTYAELGYPGYVYVSWYGLVAPAGTPAAIVNKLHQETVRVLKDNDITTGIARDGGTTIGNTPQEFARDIRNESDDAARVIKAAKIKL